MVALLGLGLLLLVLGPGGILLALGLGRIMLGLGGFLLGLGLGLLLLGLGLGLLDLWLGLTEGVLQLGIVDHLLILDGLGVDLLLLLDHLGLGLGLGGVEVALRIGHSGAASHLRRVGDLLDLGAVIHDPPAGESGLGRGLAGGLAAWRFDGGRVCAEPEGLELLRKRLGGRGVVPRVVVELGPECGEGLLELDLEGLHDPGEVALLSLQLV